MTIGIDIRVLARGARTGIEEYTINLLSRLLSLGKDENFKLFYNAYNKIDLEYEWLRLPNVDLKKFNYPNRFIFDPLAKFFNLPEIDLLLGGVDVFFAPHFFLAPVSKNCRKVVVFHDLSFEYFPEFFTAQKRFWHFFLNPKQRAREADKIIAVSGSTKNDLIDWYGVDAEKIDVIYSGVGEEFKKLDNPPSPPFERGAGEVRDSEKIKGKYKLPDKFILYFGTIEPRKNLIGLIKAYEVFRAENNSELKLVIAGSPGWKYKKIFEQAKKSKFASDIIFAGFIDPADKTYLYNLASLFVYPSFFEGFGFPPLEAMACGVPVVCSHTSSFPEVAGDAALMCDPYNYGEIAWAMAEITRNNNLSDFLIKKGLEQAKKFSWDECAEKTLSLIKSRI